MDNLLNIDGTIKAFPNPEATQIGEFETLIEEADKPERVLAYIYHMESNESAYINYSSEMKPKEIKKDLFGDEEWEEPDYVREARQKYIELTKTPEQRLLEKAVDSVYKLIDYLDEFDPTERDENNKLVWKTKDYIRNMEKLSGVVDSLEDLRERVDKGEGSKGDIRGGVELTEYNK